MDGDPARMVAAPDGDRWVVEARRGELGVGFLVVRSLAGAEMFRELLDDSVDPGARVDEVADAIEAGTWRGERRAAGGARPVPTVAAGVARFGVWLFLVTPAALLAWVVWLAGGVSGAWPVAATVVWAAAGVVLASRR